MTQFSQEQQDAYYNAQPKKPIGGSVILFDRSGRILIARPSYKPGWVIPGGCVEENESPLTAALREVREETGVELKDSDLTFVGVRYVSGHEARRDHLQIFFKAVLSDTQASKVTLQKEELAEFRFVDIKDLGDYADHYRIKALIAFLEAKAPAVYQENSAVLATS